jgi:hypothetical protein
MDAPIGTYSDYLQSTWEPLDALGVMPFDEVERRYKIRIYGVDYIVLEDPSRGQLFVTEHGWVRRECLMPEAWYDRAKYSRVGERLQGSTGVVYRVPTTSRLGLRYDLVVKFSRFAQDVPLQVPETFPVGVPLEVIENAHFNDPFREFGLIRELRLGRYGPREFRIRTKVPLGIYSPTRQYSPWQMGRADWLFDSHQRDLRRELELCSAEVPHHARAFEFHARRDYIMLFGWVKGIDAEALYRQGVLSRDELESLSYRVFGEMAQKGFRVLDNKPRHFILRQRPDGTMLRRDGEIVYAVIDFELLQRTEEYEEYVRLKRWEENKHRGAHI